MTAAFSPLSLLTPVLLLLLGAGLLLLWWRWRSRTELGWMGVGLVCNGLATLLQMQQGTALLPAHVLSFSVCYLCGTGAVARSLAVRMGVPLPWKAAVGVVVVVLGLLVWYSALQPDLALRIGLLNAGVLLLLTLPLWHWRQMVLRNRFDRVLRWVYVGCIVLHLVRALALVPLAAGMRVLEFSHTTFWVTLHCSALLPGVALAGCMLVAVGWRGRYVWQQERRRDGLTGVLHQRGFAEQLGSLERQGGQHWTLLLCELDRWPWVQAQWGAATADHVLQAVAQLLQRHVRAADVVARLDGAVFVVLLQGRDMTAAMPVAGRIRREVAQLRLPQRVGERVTLSMGVTAVQALDAVSMGAAMAVARELVASARQAGCNRVRGGGVPAPPLALEKL